MPPLFPFDPLLQSEETMLPILSVETSKDWPMAGRPPGSRRVNLQCLVLALLVGLAGCDVPTELPRWDQRWIVPADETTVQVQELLPDGVTAPPGSGTFSVDVDPVSFQESLGELCAVCGPLNGQLVPKPAFEGSFLETASFPEDVLESQVAEGRARILATNGFSFDPLRPGGGATGTITLSLYEGGSGGRLLDRVVLDGATESFPPGTNLTQDLEFSGTVRSPLVADVAVSSPAGDPVTLDVSEILTVETSVLILEVSSALVDVAGRELTLEETELEVEDLDETVVDRIQSGAFNLEVANPWSIGATFSVTIQGPGPTVAKGFSIPAGPSSSARVKFTQSELQSFLGEPNVFLRGTGVVEEGEAPVTLVPGQELVLDTELDLVIRVGSEEG